MYSRHRNTQVSRGTWIAWLVCAGSLAVVAGVCTAWVTPAPLKCDAIDVRLAEMQEARQVFSMDLRCLVLSVRINQEVPRYGTDVYWFGEVCATEVKIGGRLRTTDGRLVRDEVVHEGKGAMGKMLEMWIPIGEVSDAPAGVVSRHLLLEAVGSRELRVTVRVTRFLERVAESGVLDIEGLRTKMVALLR